MEKNTTLTLEEQRVENLNFSCLLKTEKAAYMRTLNSKAKLFRLIFDDRCV
jgi:hypothetical protein